MGKEWDSGKSFVERKAAKPNTFDHVGGNHNPANSKDQQRTRHREGIAYQEFMHDSFTEALRVAKPGAHLLAFGGTRTFHRLAVAIEDAGWEIRDTVMWVYGSGLAKALTCAELAYVFVLKVGMLYHVSITKLEMGMANRQPNTTCDLCGKRSTDARICSSRTRESFALRLAGTRFTRRLARGSNPKLAGENNPAWSGELYRAGERVSDDTESEPSASATEWVCSGAHSGSREDTWPIVDGGGGGPSHQPGSGGQQAGEPEGLRESSGALDGRALHGRGQCPRCGKLLKEYEGFGTSLKPAFEPIIVARKPLDGTVAGNVLKHGCGALNVDGCRITADGGRPLREIDPKQTNNNAYAGRMDGSLQGGSKAVGETTLGRFPANLIHDGSPEVVALFPQTESGTLNQGSITSENRIYGKRGGYDNPTLYQGNQGSAAASSTAPKPTSPTATPTTRTRP